jgi:hypothetical protein
MTKQKRTSLEAILTAVGRSDQSAPRCWPWPGRLARPSAWGSRKAVELSAPVLD